jgi:hypothetical protein
MAAIGGLVAILVTVWFYNTAVKLQLNPWQWIIAALIIFYGVKFLWIKGILKPLLGSSITATSSWVIRLIFELSADALAAFCAMLFRSRVMLKQKPK